MSTIAKLDRRVRLDRYLRKEQRREMQKDLAIINTIIASGRKITQSKDWPHYTKAAQSKHARLLQEMTVRQTIMKLTLKHITAIMLDPARSGVRKEAILEKLGMTVEKPTPVIQTAIRDMQFRQASTPVEGIT